MSKREKMDAMSGRRHGVTKGDRLVGTSGGLRVYIGPDEYDGNPRIKVADPFLEWEKDDPDGEGEWTLNLKRHEVYDLVRVLMAALDDY